MSDIKKRVRVIISGRVQGVFFRSETKKKAESLRILGFVQNLPDGKVEAVLEGEEESMREMIKWMGKGSFLTKVDNIEIKEEGYNGEFNSFEIKY